MWYQQSTGVQRDSLAQRAWYQGYQGYQRAPTHSQWYQRLNMWVLGCRETHWHREHGTKGTEGYQHIVSGTKDSACGISRVLGCRETHWHRAWYQGYRGVSTQSEWYQRLNMLYLQSTGVQRDLLAQREWY